MQLFGRCWGPRVGHSWDHRALCEYMDRTCLIVKWSFDHSTTRRYVCRGAEIACLRTPSPESDVSRIRRCLSRCEMAALVDLQDRWIGSAFCGGPGNRALYIPDSVCAETTRAQG